jgi:hypothetical protein
MNLIRKDSARGLIDGATTLYQNHSFNGKFDFNTTQANDTFFINGRRMGASDFGNLAAGYAGVTYDTLLGYFGMRIFGIVYDIGDGGPTYFDDDGSAELIDEGADLADCERKARYHTDFFRTLDGVAASLMRAIEFRWLH